MTEQDIAEIRGSKLRIPKADEDGIRRYGVGINKSTPEDPKRCMVEVWTNDRWPTSHQCHNNRGHGPGGLLCKLHLRQIEKIKADRIEWDRKIQLEKEGKVDREIGSIKWEWNNSHTCCILIVTIEDIINAKYGISISDIIGIDNGKTWYATINGKTVGGKFDTPQLAMGFVEQKIVDLIRRI